jgi:hypothetical protein
MALCQKIGYKKFNGWRDNVLNGIIERRLQPNGDFFHDIIGLNMHRSSESFSTVVGRYSAGCQVRQYNEDHKMIMNIVNKALERFSNSFSYTLFDEEEVFPDNFKTKSGARSKVPQWPNDYVKFVK